MNDLIQKLRAFTKDRDWEKYHSPKTLMALSVEVGEIVELFQWMKEEQSKKLNKKDDRKTQRRDW